MPAAVPVTIDGAGGPLTVTPFRQVHGDIETMGLRVGGLAYSLRRQRRAGRPRCRISGTSTCGSSMRCATSRTRATSASTRRSRGSQRIGARRAVLTHMHIDLDYATLKRELPEGVEPAYDGMAIELPLD